MDEDMMKMKNLLMVSLVGLLVGGAMACQTPQTDETAVADEPQAMEEQALEAEAQEQALEAEAEADEMARPGGRTLSEEELLSNHRMVELERTADREFSNPGTTGWRRADLPDGMGGPAMDSPGEVLAALRAESRVDSQLGTDVLEITSRMAVEGDQATGVLLLWWLMDDSVIGRDMKLTMEREGQGWMPVSLEERFHCLRGVDGELCL